MNIFEMLYPRFYFDSSTMDNYANIYELWYDEEINGRK